MVDYKIELTETGYREIDNKAYELLVEGSMGSGKTTFACYKTILYALNNSEAEIYVFRQSLPRLKKTSWKVIRNILRDMGFDLSKIENKSNAEIIIPQTDSTIQFMSLEDLDAVRSINADLIYIEQMEELKNFRDFYMSDLLGRLNRGRACIKHGAYSQMIGVVQPSSPSHWIYKYFHKMEDVNARYDFETKHKNLEMSRDEFLAEKRKDRNIIFMSYKENKFLPKRQRQHYDDLKYMNYDLYRRFSLGEWISLEGQVYTNYDTYNGGESVDFYCLGVDFGYSNPACSLLLGFNGNEVYVVDEVYTAGLTNEELVDVTTLMLDKHKMLPDHLFSVAADMQNPDGVEQFVRKSYPVNKDFKKPNVISSINQVMQMKLHINKRCKNTLTEIENYVFQKKNDVQLEVPVKFNDHAMDAMRYAINNILTNHKNNIINAGDDYDGWDMIIVT